MVKKGGSIGAALRRRFKCVGRKGSNKTGLISTDRAKKVSKHYILTDGRGVPLAKALTAPNVDDDTTIPEMLNPMPAVCVRQVRRRMRLAKLRADNEASRFGSPALT